MQSLTRYKISVRMQAYLLLSLSFLWWVTFFALEIVVDGDIWLGLLNFLLYLNPVLALFLLLSARKAGGTHPWLARSAVFAGISPWLMFLCIMLGRLIGFGGS